MESRQLRYFVQVVRSGGFSRAAGRLGVAQPALSRHVRMLEQELGIQLLHRTAKGAEPTEAGRRLFDLASGIIRDLDDIPVQLRRSASEPCGTVALGVPASLAHVLAPPLGARVRDELPGVDLSVVDGLSAVLCDWVESGDIDLSVLVYSERLDLQSRAVRWVDLASEDIVFVGAPALLPDDRRSIRVREVAQFPFVTAEGYLSHLEPGLSAAGIRLKSEMDLNSVASIRETLLRGLYCALVPYAMVHKDVADGRLVALRLEDVPATRRLVLCFGLHRVDTLKIRSIRSLLETQARQLPLRIAC